MTATKPHVVITDFINDSLDVEHSVLNGIATVEAFDALDEQELVGKIESADAVMMYHNLALTAFTVKRLEQCKLIVRCGVGFDNVDHALARELGIPVANVPDYGTEEVADSAIGMALALRAGSTNTTCGCDLSRIRGCITLLRPFTGFAGEFSASSDLAESAPRLLDARARWGWMFASMTPSSRTATTKRMAFVGSNHSKN